MDVMRGLDTGGLGGKEVFYYEETDSTNARAWELAEAGAPEGTLVVADRQTRGRGRRGRTWFSPSDAGIYASLILRPAVPPTEATRITFLTAVAAAEALIQVTGLDVRIKWPNDLLVGEKKLAGILTEVHAGKRGLDYAVVGLGINVNTPEFPDDLKDTATSVRIETGRAFPKEVILREYLKREEERLREWRTRGFEPILRRWKELADTIGRRVRVEVGGQTSEGWVEDVDPEGALVLRGRGGERERIVAGQVTLL